MPIVGKDAKNQVGSSADESPVDAIEPEKSGVTVFSLDKALNALEGESAEIRFGHWQNDRFVEARGLDRIILEGIFSKEAEKRQDPTLFNKWIQIDDKVDKALKTYVLEVKIALANASTQNVANETMANAAAEAQAVPQPPTPTPSPETSAREKQLPTQSV